MYKLALLGLAAAALLAIPGCSMAAKGYTKVSPEVGKEMLAKDKITLVDVREVQEFSAGHIPGAKLISLGTIEREAPKQLKDKKAKIMVYCRSGVRSKKAADQLLSMGYEEVYDLGGIIDWPYEVEK
jgi:phage shock protein E